MRSARNAILGVFAMTSLLLTITPDSFATENFTFYSIYHEQSTESNVVQKITIDTKGVVKKISSVTTGDYTLQILDEHKGTLLLESGPPYKFYILSAGGYPAPLLLNTENSIDPTLVRLSADTRGIFTVDGNWNIDYASVSSLNSPQKVVDANSFNNLMATVGANTSHDWLADFYSPALGEMYIETVNNQTNVVRLWHVFYDSGTGTVTQGKLVTQIQGDTSFLEISEMAVSPDGSKIALIANSSQITPMMTLQVISTMSDSVQTVSHSRFYQGQNYFLSFLNDSTLISTCDKVWKIDPNGGRMIYSIPLTGKNYRFAVPNRPGSYLFPGN